MRNMKVLNYRYRLETARDSVQIKHRSRAQIKRLKTRAGVEITEGSSRHAKNSVSI